ncbi:hypothetical protein [Alphaproteobacteria bacterium endosymbiont of Tiliacea citrago]|uniref:hypothetical protein n=1 Tax=Alphaproteobacteria bacterium endosymbiont of Tiliacea citrago TaxID=3077944 RepID=UPI00313F18CB
MNKWKIFVIFLLNKTNAPEPEKITPMADKKDIERLERMIKSTEDLNSISAKDLVQHCLNLRSIFPSNQYSNEDLWFYCDDCRKQTKVIGATYFDDDITLSLRKNSVMASQFRNFRNIRI